MDDGDGPAFDLIRFLSDRRRPASVATVTPLGRPALALMWFVLDDGRLWFHTPDSGTPASPFLMAAAAGREVAAMVATFDPPHDVRQVRITGPARLEEHDHRRVRQIYDRYVDNWEDRWERQATAPDYRLWSMLPQRGMAVAYPNLDDGPTFRWSQPSDLVGLQPHPRPK